MSWTFKSRVLKKPIFINLASPFIACDLIFLPSELFRIVISCKIVNSSMKFKFIHIISVVQEKFLVFFNLLRGSDVTRSKAESGPRAAVCVSLIFILNLLMNKRSMISQKWCIHLFWFCTIVFKRIRPHHLHWITRITINHSTRFWFFSCSYPKLSSFSFAWLQR